MNKEYKVTEIELDDKKINELINKLKELKESKEHIHFSVNNGGIIDSSRKR